MRISQIFRLRKSQAELDFVDIDTTLDMPLFLDPFFLSKRKDRWSVRATETLKSFFQEVIRVVRAGEIVEAKELFDYLHEPNATCLGVSTGDPRGRGVGKTDTDNIFESLIRSRAIQTGLLQDIEDSVLFVEHFGKDKLSDMTTNIITKLLIDYTNNQCMLHNIPLTPNIPTGFFWNDHDTEWQSEYSDGLVVGGRRIILVPKGIVSFCDAYTPSKYYNHFVLQFLQNEHLRLDSAFVQKRKNGNRYVTKISIKKGSPFSKEFLRTFTARHPEVLERFKNKTKTGSLRDQVLRNVNLAQVVNSLVARLGAIAPGDAGATPYHRLMIGILEIIFYPHLINPRKEVEINEGRKRIDITFDNAATAGIFQRLADNMGLPCNYIFIECKNYTRDVQNPELDQIAGRFHVNRGRVGFIVCRAIDDHQLFIRRCSDTYAAGNGLVIPLVDADVVTLLRGQRDHDLELVEQFLSSRIREIMLG